MRHAIHRGPWLCAKVAAFAHSFAILAFMGVAHGGTTLAMGPAAPPGPESWRIDTALAPCPGTSALGRTVTSTSEWILAAAWHDDDLGITSPIVHAWSFIDGAWSCMPPIEHPTDDPHADFGRSLSIDGDVLAVGAPDESVLGHHAAGAVHLYRRHGHHWVFSGSVHAPVVQGGSAFGSSVALRGNTLLVGSPRWDAGASGFDEGRADVYDLGGFRPTHRSMLWSPTPALGGRFGWAVALHDAGPGAMHLAIGAPWEAGSDGTTRVGAVHVGRIGTAPGSTPGLVDRLGGSEHDEWFGWSLALTQDELVIGVPRADGGALEPSTIGRRRGCVVTTLIDEAGTLSALQRTWGGSLPEEHVGWSIAVHDGWLVTGAPAAGAAGSLEGAVYLCRRTASPTAPRGPTARWRLMQRITQASARPGDGLGAGVAINGPWIVASRTGDPEQPVQPGFCLVLSPEWVHPFNDLAPSLGALAGDEGILHGTGIGVVGGELDPELAHVAAGGPIAVDDAR
ncbi:MAG: hypothetical protein RLZZ246_280, partial [Planctomycetota bacterium]